ncbi:MAG: hypothetical protein C5B48_15420 [Candidatus Rokuibacteriota bacterium]|nr:MAG: hypothetical protein C5B48_15420 [Candidatus Rokubacteria bacterium]
MSTSTRSLVISADDFGFTPQVNRGIIEAFEAGAITAVSMMVRLPGWQDAARYARITGPELDVGLHLNLIVGAPLTRARSLTNHATGAFLPTRTLAARAFSRRIDVDEVYAECMAQAGQLVDAGLTVTHLDGHLHLHVLRGVWEGVVEAAKALGNLPIRVPRERALVRGKPERRAKRVALGSLSSRALRRATPPVAPLPFVGGTLYGDSRYLERLCMLVEGLPAGTSELMTHPGYASGSLPGGDTYDAPREFELRALMSPELRDALAATDVTLTSFRARSAPARS